MIQLEPSCNQNIYKLTLRSELIAVNCRQVLDNQVYEYGAVVAVHHPVVAHSCTNLACSGCPVWLTRIHNT